MKAVWLLGALAFLGSASVVDDPSAEPGLPIPGLGKEETSRFDVGRSTFLRVWTPHATYYNARSCNQCHNEPSFGGASPNPFNMAFFTREPAEPSGWKPFPWLVWRGRPAGQRLPQGEFESRRPQPLYGLGLLEAVPVDETLKRADPDDADKDGISGRLVKLADGRYGRFGWRASEPTVAAFVRGAFENEMGLRLNEGLADNVLSPEMVHLVADSIRLLAPPKPRTSGADAKGKLIFVQVGCAKCHTPEWTTGYSELPALKNRKISPYTDMLVHDVARGKAQPETGDTLNIREFRTAPLGGLGLHDGPYWHDGSTGTLSDAVDRHEGEALGSRDKWRALPAADRKALLSFLRSL